MSAYTIAGAAWCGGAFLFFVVLAWVGLRKASDVSSEVE